MNSVAYNWYLATEFFFYGELWNLRMLVDEIQVEKMLIPSWKSMELEELKFIHVMKFHGCILVAIWWILEVTYIGFGHG